MGFEENVFDVFDRSNVEEESIVVENKIPETSHNEKGQNIPSERKWIHTQKAEDFPNFLLLEIKRIKPPQACVGNKSEIERALAQNKKLDSYISKALQSDYDEKLDAKGIDNLRKKIENSIEQLENMLHGIDEIRKNRKRMKRRGEENCNLVKEAGVARVNYFITAFQRAITGAIINGKVSNGNNLEELYAKAKKKYNINDREELEIFQILADMGYPVFKDRLRIDEDQNPTKGLGEWQKQYYA